MSVLLADLSLPTRHVVGILRRNTQVNHVFAQYHGLPFGDHSSAEDLHHGVFVLTLLTDFVQLLPGVVEELVGLDNQEAVDWLVLRYLDRLLAIFDLQFNGFNDLLDFFDSLELLRAVEVLEHLSVADLADGLFALELEVDGFHAGLLVQPRTAQDLGVRRGVFFLDFEVLVLVLSQDVVGFLEAVVEVLGSVGLDVLVVDHQLVEVRPLRLWNLLQLNPFVAFLLDLLHVFDEVLKDDQMALELYEGLVLLLDLVLLQQQFH